jgi:hypothetical protein
VVYPADKVIYVDSVDGHKVGKIGIMFYDDFTWGSFANDPPAHPTNTGGNVSFMNCRSLSQILQYPMKIK